MIHAIVVVEKSIKNVVELRMSVCPKCNNVIESSFGLTTCDKCGENFFAGAVNDDTDEKKEAVDNEEVVVDNNTPLKEGEFNDVNSEESLSEDLDFPTSDDSSSDFSNFENFQEAEGNEIKENEEKVLEESEVGEDVLEEAESLSSAFEEDISESDNAEEVSENVNLENMIEGVEKNEAPLDDIYYCIEIEGIDSPMIREKVFAQLDDHRLGWKIEDLKVKMGKLVLDNVGSVKAHVVVSAMLGLPVKVEWKQKQ